MKKRIKHCLAIFALLLFFIPEVVLAADIVIDNTLHGQWRLGRRAQVWTSSLIGYSFVVDADADLKYYKTTDGGQNWTGPTTVKSATIRGYDVWYDKWTPGNTGNLIHLAYIEADVDDALYINLDTANSDALSTETTIMLGSTVSNDDFPNVTLARMRGGNLVAEVDLDGGTEQGSFKSVDVGANWSSIAGAAEADNNDITLIFPGNESDSQDAWLLYRDISADEISLKVYDDSLNSWSETSIATGMLELSNGNFLQMCGSVRHSDNHLIFAAWSAFDSAAADLRVWDIGGTGSITEKASIVTDIDDMIECTIHIDQNTNDIRLAYLGKDDGSETVGTSLTVNYKLSTNGGTSWGAQQAYSESAIDADRIWSDLGGTDTRFMPVFQYQSTNHFAAVNYVNSVAITPPAAAAPARSNYLFSGFRLTIFNGRMILYQR